MSHKRGSASGPSPSPIPPHIRPPVSRHHSSSSTGSSRHPHPQQREYVPSTLEGGFSAEPGTSGLGERWAFEHAEHPGHAPHAHRHVEGQGQGEDDLDEEEEDTGSEADWNAAKEQADARRPKWRRASPRWLYPFVSGATLALGMGMAPRSELYVNLACLAHPPQMPSTLTAEAVAEPPVARGFGMYSFHSLYMDSLFRATTEIGIGEGNLTDTIGIPSVPEDVSPADRWFYKLQRDIYEYEAKHQHRDKQPAWSTSVVSTPTDHSSRVPKPTETVPAREQPSTPSGGREAGEPGTAGPPYRQIDPKICKRDPKVQAAAARLVMMMTLTMGILAALTTGYWGQMSDRIGRTKIMAIMETGLLLNEACFIIVATFPYRVPGGYRALLVGPILEGCLGGISTLTATVNAYVSDTTPDGSRASIFARLGGIFMVGFACGPVLGSAVIKATGNIMTPFYLNICVHLFYITMIILVLPESLSKEARTILKKTAKIASDAQKRQDTLAREWENETPAAGPEIADPFLTATPGSTSGVSESERPGWSRRFSMSAPNAQSSKRHKKFAGLLRRTFRTATAFLQPLAVFLPTEKEDGGKDWNMTVTGAALFAMSFMMVRISWTELKLKANRKGCVSDQGVVYHLYFRMDIGAGPFMSLLGFSRGFVMLVLLPLCIRLAKPYFMPPPRTASPDAGTSGFSVLSDATARPSSESSPLLAPPPVKPRRPATLDLWTARISLAWEAILYLILALNLPEIPFIIVSTLITLSSGSNPAANSLALSFIPNSREVGKLFGGVAVLHALGSTLLGPLAFGTLFSVTVGNFTPAVWALGGVVQLVSLGFMCFVRIPVDRGPEGGAERGRSKRVKTVRSSSGLRK